MVPITMPVLIEPSMMVGWYKPKIYAGVAWHSSAPWSTKSEDKSKLRFVMTTPKMTMMRLATLLTSMVCLVLGSTPPLHIGHSHPLIRSMVTTLEQEIMAESAVDMIAASEPSSTMPPVKMVPLEPCRRTSTADPK
jgi:hypothetical protein